MPPPTDLIPNLVTTFSDFISKLSSVIIANPACTKLKLLCSDTYNTQRKYLTDSQERAGRKCQQRAAQTHMLCHVLNRGCHFV
jgi:DNA replication initiation complex subunit (GINS family)